MEKTNFFLPIVEYLCLGILRNLNRLKITSNNSIGFENYKILLMTQILPIVHTTRIK